MQSKADKDFLRSGQLAQAAGISSDTLRHYERRGLLSPRRSANGYREYGAESLARVRLIQRALSVGFTLEELARILQVRDRGGAPCREVRALAAAKLAAIDAQISATIQLRSEFCRLVDDWDIRLAQTPKGERARLLETWAESNASAGEKAALASRRKRGRGKPGK